MPRSPLFQTLAARPVNMDGMAELNDFSAVLTVLSACG